MGNPDGAKSWRRGGRSAILGLALLAAGSAGVARSQVITEFPVPTVNADVDSIVAGPDGNLWFTENNGNKIGRITTAGVITEFPVPTAASGADSIAVGPDGNIWFSEEDVNKIGRITTAGVITEFPIPTAASSPDGIAAGPDGNIWFTEEVGHKIGRITTAGVVTGEFPTPTAGSEPENIAAGPDGNLWFTERTANQIGRITTAGVITEFPTPTAASAPDGIVTGPDGNIWFTERNANQIGRITPAGIITEFPVPTAASAPLRIAAGPDGNLWFTEEDGNQIGRITTAGVITEFPIPTAASDPEGIAAGPDGSLWFCERDANKIGVITTGPATPQPMAVDAHSVTGSSSNANGVLESGETVLVAPSWKNTLTIAQTFTGTASNLTGPPGPTYTIDDGSADYGTISPDATGDCDSATGDCYLMTVSGARPVDHWDATFTEDLSVGSITKAWTLHVGDSFTDVPTSHQFYRFVENLFHNGVTGGCGAGIYCPSNSVTRAQMAVFLLKGKLGASHVPPPATGTVFNDVQVGDFAADWIEELAGFQITGGCGGGNYCPTNPVTRAQMSAFLLKSKHGSAFTPPACTGIFADVPCPSLFADWIEQLAAEGITAGCGGGNYCPNDPNTRGQMAVFLVKTFGLLLYGP
jgi:streptogramin lyase